MGIHVRSELLLIVQYLMVRFQFFHFKNRVMSGPVGAIASPGPDTSCSVTLPMASLTSVHQP